MNRECACALLPAVVLLCLAPAPASATDILVNGYFDAVPIGTGWVQDDGTGGLYPLIVPGSVLPPGAAPQSPPNAVWLGGLPSITQTMHQDITVPTGATKLKLTGYLWISSEEISGVFDHLYAEVVAPGGGEMLGHWTNVDENASWTAFSVEASGNYAGQTIRLRFRSTTDASLNTNFFLDTCVLDGTTAVDVPQRLPATSSRLFAARPNPTRGGAQLRLDLAGPTLVRAGIYDLSGRLVRRIADGFREGGSHDLTWDGTDARGGRVASGVYVCRVDVGGHSLSQKLALVR